MPHQCNQDVSNKESSEINLRSGHQSWYVSEKCFAAKSVWSENYISYRHMAKTQQNRKIFPWRRDLVLVQSLNGWNAYLHRGWEHLCPRLLVEGPTGQCPCSRLSHRGRTSQSMVCVCLLEGNDIREEKVRRFPHFTVTCFWYPKAF